MAGIGAHKFRLLIEQSMLAEQPICAGAEELFLVRDQAVDVSVESADLKEFAGVLGGPPVNFAIASGAEDSVAIRAEGDSEDWLAMTIVGFLEFTGFRIEEARGLVSAGGGEVETVGSEREGHDPVSMLFEAPLFPAAGNVENADTVVRAASDQALAVWAEGEGEKEIVGGGERAEGRAGPRMDKFYFTGSSWSAASEGEELAIRTVGEGLDLLRRVWHAAKQSSVRGVPDRDFVVAAGGEFHAVRIKRECEDRDRAGVDRRRIGMTCGRVQGGKESFGIGTIEAGALGNPASDELSLSRWERVVLLRHAIVSVGGDQELVEFALGRVARDDCCVLAFAGLQEFGEGVKSIAALGFLRVVAGHALGLEQRRDLPAEADVAWSGRGFCGVKREK